MNSQSFICQAFNNCLVHNFYYSSSVKLEIIVLFLILLICCLYAWIYCKADLNVNHQYLTESFFYMISAFFM